MSSAAGTPSDGGGDRPWQSYHTAYTNAKAGMEGVDKEKVQKVIYEMSKGFENEQKEAITKLKIEHLRTQCAKLTDNDISHFQKHLQVLQPGSSLSPTHTTWVAVF
ncbi:DNA polymerase kappa-like [Triticum dicoccoides]|uniref:DNA polymerase kappa-like n=1 Tax=Triticum dicoccoides TaxID=85692 RepID=UPI00188E2A34|nr:DNA polymerase kappa-like [Triticum dicoccoides]